MKKFKLKATEKHTTFLIPKGLTYEKLRDKGFLQNPRGVSDEE